MRLVRDPSSKEDEETMDLVEMICSAQVMLMYIVALLIYACKTKGKMYLRTGFLIISYVIVFASRLIMHVLQFLDHEKNHPFYSVFAESASLVVNNMIWISLYFFIFEIERINMTLQANNHQYLKKGLDRKRKINITILIIYIIGIVVFDGIQIKDNFDEQRQK